MEFLLAFAFALLLSTLLVPFFMQHAYAAGLIDAPSEARKIHTTAIPRCGGLGIIFGAFLASVYWLEYSSELLSLGLASAVIVVFGYLDDSRDLNYRWKFAGQILAALVLMAGGVVLERLPFFGLDAAPAYISYPLTLLFLLGVTNAVNLSDGLDGLAAGNTLLGLSLIAYLSMQLGESSSAILALAIIGGVMGFLRYNTHPAKVFMGDTGSQFLGFITATLAIVITQREHAAMSPMLPVLILGLPILDTLMVMLIRVHEGRSMFSPDRNHLHHRLMSLGFHHYEVVAVLYTLQAILVVMAFMLRYEADGVLLAVYAGFCAVVLGALVCAQRAGFHLRHKQPVDARERRNHWLRRIDWYHFHSSHVIEGGLALFFVASALYVTPASTSFSLMGLGFAGLLVGLWLAGLWLAGHWLAGHWLLGRWPAVSTRIITYTASAFITYSFAFSMDNRPVFNTLVDGYLALLLLALVLAIRMTQRAIFRLDTHDYLVFFMLLAVPLVPNGLLDQASLGRLLLRFALLIYACEFLLSKRPDRHNWLNVAGILCLVLLGLSGDL